MARQRAERSLRWSLPADPFPMPDTSCLDPEDAARVLGEYFYWEDYGDRNGIG